MIMTTSRASTCHCSCLQHTEGSVTHRRICFCSEARIVHLCSFMSSRRKGLLSVLILLFGTTQHLPSGLNFMYDKISQSFVIKLDRVGCIKSVQGLFFRVRLIPLGSNLPPPLLIPAHFKAKKVL